MDLPYNINTSQNKCKAAKEQSISVGASTSLALMNSLINTQKAIGTISGLSSSLSLVTEKYMDSLAKNTETNEALKSISEILDENYSDDIELKTLIEKALNKNSSSYHNKYIRGLHELSSLAHVVSLGIRDYDGDVNMYYRFQDKLNDLGLL